MRGYSTIPDFLSVIYLGHKAKQPLIRSLSELVDGFEPTALFTRRAAPVIVGTDWCGREGVPGVVQTGGYLEGGIPGTQPEARLRLIYGISKINGSYGRLTV